MASPIQKSAAGSQQNLPRLDELAGVPINGGVLARYGGIPFAIGKTAAKPRLIRLRSLFEPPKCPQNQKFSNRQTAPKTTNSRPFPRQSIHQIRLTAVCLFVILDWSFPKKHWPILERQNCFSARANREFLRFFADFAVSNELFSSLFSFFCDFGVDSLWRGG